MAPRRDEPLTGLVDHRSYARRVGWGSCIGALLLVAGCRDVEPQQAPGFRIENLARVSIGQTKSEVLQIMGSPLLEDAPRRQQDGENLRYARPGARWSLGEYRTAVRGVECRISIQKNRVVAIMYADPVRAACFCNTAPCPVAWLDKCLQGQSPSMP